MCNLDNFLRSFGFFFFVFICLYNICFFPLKEKLDITIMLLLGFIHVNSIFFSLSF